MMKMLLLLNLFCEGILDVQIAYLTQKRKSDPQESKAGVKQFFDEVLAKHYGFFCWII